MRAVFVAVCLALAWAAPARAATVTIIAPTGDKVGPEAHVAAHVVADSVPTVTFALGTVSAPATVVAAGDGWDATATLDTRELEDSGGYDLIARASGDEAFKSLHVDLSVRLGLPTRFVTADPQIAITADPDTTLECRFGSDDFAPCTSPWHPAVGADGDYAYDVRATDDVGNRLVGGSSFVLQHPPPDTAPAPTTSAPDVREAGGVLPATAERVEARVSLKAKRTRAWTRLRSLRLTHVPKGVAITARCHGGGCPRRALKLVSRGRPVSLARLTGRRLKPGAVITIALRRDGKLLQTLKITIRRTAAPRVQR